MSASMTYYYTKVMYGWRQGQNDSPPRDEEKTTLRAGPLDISDLCRSPLDISDLCRSLYGQKKKGRRFHGQKKKQRRLRKQKKRERRWYYEPWRVVEVSPGPTMSSFESFLFEEEKRLREQEKKERRLLYKQREKEIQVMNGLGDGIFVFLRSIIAENHFDRMLKLLKMQKVKAKVVKLNMKMFIDRHLHSRKKCWTTFVEGRENSKHAIEIGKENNLKEKETPYTSINKKDLENSMKYVEAEKVSYIKVKKTSYTNMNTEDRLNSNSKFVEIEKEDAVMQNRTSYTHMNNLDCEYNLKCVKVENEENLTEKPLLYTSMKNEDRKNSMKSTGAKKENYLREKETSYTNMNMESESQEHQRICKICLDADLCMVFFPCRHLVACEACSDRLTNCAVCRSLIRGSIKVNFM